MALNGGEAISDMADEESALKTTSWKDVADAISGFVTRFDRRADGIKYPSHIYHHTRYLPFGQLWPIAHSRQLPLPP